MQGGTVKLFEMNTVTTVKEVKLFNGQPIDAVTVTTKNSGATSIPVNDNAVWHSDGINASLRTIEEIEATGGGQRYITSFTDDRLIIILPTIAKADSSYADKTVTFNTTQLSEIEAANGYSFVYTIECMAKPIVSSGMIEYLSATARTNVAIAGSWDLRTSRTYDIVPTNLVKFSTSINVKDMSVEAEGGAFLMKGVKYSCYDLLRRALLTIDTQLIDNSTTGLDELDRDGQIQPSLEYPIIVSDRWINRLKTAVMYETIFEGKNLWEVLIQIGYYIHAIPYLEFATDGTDRFVLNFRQLGDTKTKQDSSTKITIFNSRNLDEYFTQYDSYVTNLFSPQNELEEWIVPKTSDGSFLVSNDTAELQTSRPILEIIEFDITYNNVTKDALQYVFENSVYQVLTSDNPIRIKPAKGNSIYYNYGDNKILGLQYVPPSVNPGTYQYSLQEIIRRLFGSQSWWGDLIGLPQNIKYNNLMFHIKYRTQDNLRVSQIRPDIGNFVKNSSYEKYPHHEQFYGQQDKIVDSERFSANLYGKLIRVGNALYQCNEYAKNVQDEKEAGDLVTINGEPYYVTSISNELYPDSILQQVTYTKNFNQLSQIVTIPSEPRFYEVSERSKIRREVRIMEFIELSTTPPADNTTSPKFMTIANMQEFLKTVLFNKDGSWNMPNFAYTKFLADSKRQHKGSYGQYVDSNVLFPSSDIDRSDPNSITPQAPKSYSDNITTLLHFPLHDGIVFEWDIVDNFSAGDFIDTSISGSANTANQAYYAQQPVRYVDILGRADLFQFKLFNKTDWTPSQAQTLPKAITIPADNDSEFLTPNGLSIALDKDNREELSFNYQINLLHMASSGDDDFITFPNLFGKKDSDLRMCILNLRQSLFNENIDLSGANIIADNLTYTLSDIGNCVQLSITPPTTINEGYNKDTYLNFTKSVVVYQVNEYGGRYAYIVKNVNRLSDSDKLQPWYIYPVFNS